MKLMTPSNDADAFGAGGVHARNHAALRIQGLHVLVDSYSAPGRDAPALGGTNAEVLGGPKQQRPSG